MGDARLVRRFLRAEHRDLLGTALLLAGGRSAAADLVDAATSRALRRHGAARLTADAVREEMARAAAAGRADTGQVLDARLGGADDDLGPLAAALDDLPDRVRTVAVLRIADDVPVDDVARTLHLPAADVRAAENEARVRLARPAGGNDRLPGLLDALAAVPPDDGAPDRAADAVLGRRRRRRRTAALAVAGLLAAVPATIAVADRTPGTVATDEDRAEPPVRPADDTPVEVLAGPPRGSLAADEDFLDAARSAPWGTGNGPPLAARRVVYGAETLAGRVALVVADTPSGLDGAWLLGPRGAPADDLAPWVPERIGRSSPTAVLVEGAEATAVVVVAAPGDAVEFSPRLRSEPTGAVDRTWSAVPVEDGIAVVDVAGPTDGRAAAVRVVRNNRVVARPLVTGPGTHAENVPPLTLEPVRPGTTTADPVLVAEAAAQVARPFGVGPGALSPHLLWSGELTPTGGLGSVVVLVARVPGNAHVVLPRGRLGTAPGGLEVPCGTTSFPAEVPPSVVTVATVCSVSDGPVEEPDRSWLVVTAPETAVTADVLDDDGGVLDVLTFRGGGAMTRTPDRAAQVRVVDGDGRTLDISPIAPAPESPFGDYGDG